MRITTLVRIICGVCTLATAFSAVPAAAKASEREAVLAKIVAAYGGRTVLDTIKSMRVEIATTIQSEPATITTTEVPPNRTLVVFSITGGLRVTSGFDGAHGWVQDSYGHVKILSGDQLTQTRCQSTDEIYEVEHPSRSVATITLQSPQVVDGKKYLVIEMDQSGCSPTTLFVDPQTYLIARETGSQQTIDFSGYSTGPLGEKYPKVLAITSVLGTQLATVTSIQDNVAIDDSVFAIPTSSAPSPAPGAPAPPPTASTTVTPAPTTPPVTPAPQPTHPTIR